MPDSTRPRPSVRGAPLSRSGDDLRPLFSWRSAICESGLPSTTRHVALTLSLHMNERGGSCFPGLVTLAKECGLSRQTVVTHLDALQSAGWLTKTTGGGRGKASGWEATYPETVQHVDSFAKCPSDEICPADEPKLSTSQAETVHLTDAYKEEGVERGRNKRTLAPVGAIVPQERPRDLLFEAVAESCGIDWHELTSSSRGGLVKAVAELRGIGAAPQEVRRRAEVYHSRFNGCALTPMALVKHWPTLNRPAQPAITGTNRSLVNGARWAANKDGR